MFQWLKSIGSRRALREPGSDISLPAQACFTTGTEPSTWRVWAVQAAYELKDALRARGYKWNGESNGSPRAWYIDVLTEQKDAEIHYLRTEIYRHDVDVLVRRIDSYNRFSDRA
jgi:DNA polymerase III subunit epsilon